MWIDAHCHLSDVRFKKDLDTIVQRAQQAQVKHFICPATNVADGKKLLALKQTYSSILVAVGWYPGQIRSLNNVDKAITKLEEFIKQNRSQIVAIGEIGLDGYWLERQNKIEVEMFRKQLELAVQLKLPVIIHQRNSELEILSILKNMKIKPKGEFHCWSGSEKFLRQILEWNFYVGICGNLTYKSNQWLRNLLGLIPLNRLLIETDSPYLPPKGHRGERNEPINVKIIVNEVSKIKNIKVEQLEQQLQQNTKILFNLSLKD